MIVVVELEDADGSRVISNLIDATPEEVAVGRRVEVCFERVLEDLTLPLFRLLREE